MKKIVFEINNIGAPYKFVGDCVLKNDIASFDDEDTIYEVHLNDKKIIRKNGEYTTEIDFDKERIKLGFSGKETNIEINVLEYDKKESDLFIKYKLEEEVIEVKVKMEG